MVCKNTQKGFLLFTLLKKWAKTNQNVCRRVRTSSCVLEFTSDASQTRGPSAHARRGSDWRVFLPYILWHERMCVWCMGCFSFNTDVLFFFYFYISSISEKKFSFVTGVRYSDTACLRHLSIRVLIIIPFFLLV